MFLPIYILAFLKGSHRVEDLAGIYGMVGEDEKAAETLASLLSDPGPYTRRMLERDPRFAHLEQRADFQALLPPILNLP